jgi:hypothetical protein
LAPTNFDSFAEEVILIGRCTNQNDGDSVDSSAHVVTLPPILRTSTKLCETVIDERKYEVQLLPGGFAVDRKVDPDE